jgi:hypothetical protein
MFAGRRGEPAIAPPGTADEIDGDDSPLSPAPATTRTEQLTQE